MPTFREVNTGQVVTVEDDPSHLSGLARWERIKEGLSAPANLGSDPALGPFVPYIEHDDAAARVATAMEASKDSQADLEDAQLAAADALEELAQQAVVDRPARPADDADRDEWIEYAKAHGKTDADVKGVRTTVIRGWFD